MNKKEYQKIVKRIKKCRKCELWKYRENVVPGAGLLNARIILVGEAPGKHEDRQGKPFVGRAGEILTKHLEKIGLKRNKVFITNILKCRPPENRDPKKEEMERCKTYLQEQIKIIDPQVIVTLGRYSTQIILGLKDIRVNKISRVRGKVFEMGKRVIIPTYHPAAILYNPSFEKEIRKDFIKVKEILKDET